MGANPHITTGYWVWQELPQAATSAIPSYGWVYVIQPGYIAGAVSRAQLGRPGRAALAAIDGEK